MTTRNELAKAFELIKGTGLLNDEEASQLGNKLKLTGLNFKKAPGIGLRSAADATVSEALYAFMGWLNSRVVEAGPFSINQHYNEEAALLVDMFCWSQGWNIDSKIWGVRTGSPKNLHQFPTELEVATERERRFKQVQQELEANLIGHMTEQEARWVVRQYLDNNDLITDNLLHAANVEYPNLPWEDLVTPEEQKQASAGESMIRGMVRGLIQINKGNREEALRSFRRFKNRADEANNRVTPPASY